MASKALVLGGGGTVGIAWESGLVAGLERAGVLLGAADRIVGTSAGSVVGAQLALGRSGETMLAAQLKPAQPASTGAGAAPAAAPEMTPLMALMAKRPATGEAPQSLRAEMGAFALAAETGSEDDFVAGFGRRIGEAGAEGWPQSFVCTAVDAADGAFLSWDRAASVELARGVASSCAVPGVFPPITINGRRYIDGGMRSATNADLAAGHDVVVVVAVVGNLMAEVQLARVEAEVEALRAGGGEVLLITPDEAARAVFGANMLDGSRRGEVAEAGARQGEAEAERLRESWASVASAAGD